MNPTIAFYNFYFINKSFCIVYSVAKGDRRGKLYRFAIRGEFVLFWSWITYRRPYSVSGLLRVLCVDSLSSESNISFRPRGGKGEETLPIAVLRLLLLGGRLVIRSKYS